MKFSLFFEKMWWRGSYEPDAKVSYKGPLLLHDLFNLIAEGNLVLLDSSPGPVGVKGALNANKLDETLEAAIAENIKQKYFVRAFVVFGTECDTVKNWMLSRGTSYRRNVDMFCMSETGDEILRTYSFLSQESKWEMEIGGLDSKVPHKINDFLFLGDYSAATSPLVKELGIRHIGKTFCVSFFCQGAHPLF